MLVSIIFGILIGIIIALCRLLYDHYRIKQAIKEQDLKMVKMYHQKNGYVKVAKTENEVIDNMIKNYGWTIVN